MLKMSNIVKACSTLLPFFLICECILILQMHVFLLFNVVTHFHSISVIKGTVLPEVVYKCLDFVA